MRLVAPFGCKKEKLKQRGGPHRSVRERIKGGREEKGHFSVVLFSHVAHSKKVDRMRGGRAALASILIYLTQGRFTEKKERGGG